jgi:hypothetical protein
MAYRRSELAVWASSGPLNCNENPTGDTSTQPDVSLPASVRHSSRFHFPLDGRRNGHRQRNHPPRALERERVLETRGKFLKVYGKLPNQDGVVHVKVQSLELLRPTAIEVRSDAFH